MSGGKWRFVQDTGGPAQANTNISTSSAPFSPGVTALAAIDLELEMGAEMTVENPNLKYIYCS